MNNDQRRKLIIRHPMKISYVLLLFFTLCFAKATEKISIDEFKKIRSSSDRREVIEKAPPEQRAELRKIDVHLMLISIYGEEGLREKKKS
jgi:hypothetical protein